MRLRQIKYILDSIDKQESNITASRVDNQHYRIKNIRRFKRLISELEALPFLNTEIQSIKNSALYGTTLDELVISDENTGLIGAAQSIVRGAVELSKMLSLILQDNVNSNSILIKLPCQNDLGLLINYLSKFEKSINQVISNEKIKGQLQINSWESGSFWIDLFLGSQAAIALIASITWSAAVISKKYKEGKIFEQYIKSLEIKNESLEDILEKQKIATDLLIEQEVNALQSEHFGSDRTNDNEQFERLRLTTKTFAELIQKGAEVHPALNAPEKIQNAFPNYSRLENIASKIKLLEESTDTDNTGDE